MNKWIILIIYFNAICFWKATDASSQINITIHMNIAADLHTWKNFRFLVVLNLCWQVSTLNDSGFQYCFSHMCANKKKAETQAAPRDLRSVSSVLWRWCYNCVLIYNYKVFCVLGFSVCVHVYSYWGLGFLAVAQHQLEEKYHKYDTVHFS